MGNLPKQACKHKFPVVDLAKLSDFLVFSREKSRKDSDFLVFLMVWGRGRLESLDFL